MGWEHQILEKDLESKTGTCKTCGPVGLKRIDRGGRCENTISKRYYRYYMNDGSVFRISGEKRAELIQQFGNKCGICDVKLEDSALKLDHCHDTGQFRGILCNSCNLVLGYVQDNRERLLQAVEYLNKNPA